MAGVKGRSGRFKLPGKYYRFGYRYQPGIDPPELEALLEAILAATGEGRRAILRTALLTGADTANKVANADEDFEATQLIEALFDDF